MNSQKRSRREFMGLASAGFAAAGASPWLRAAAAVSPRDADLIVTNARVFTLETNQPRAEAFAIRKGRFTVDEALRINTLNGAWSTHEEKMKGSIAPGKWADFVVLAEDPHVVDPEKIKDIKIVRTVVAGDAVYES
jgi:predicted amidohydrolase YtcJ